MGRSLLATLALAAAASTGTSASAGLIGKTFQVDYFLPDSATVYPGSSENPPLFTVTDPGVETIINVEGILNILVDFDDDSVTMTYDKLSGYESKWNTVDFNGLVFTLVSPFGPLGIAEFEVTPTAYMPGFDSSRISVTGNSIAFNWSGLAYGGPGDKDATDGVAVSARAVPEPGTLALTGAGLLGLLALGARRRRAVTPAAAAA